MASTNHTTNYNFPVFIDTDIPTWLGDWNTTMNSIDTELKKLHDSKSDVTKTYVDEKIAKINESITALNDTAKTLQSNLNSLIKNAVTWGSTNTGITAKQYEQLKIQANQEV